MPSWHKNSTALSLLKPPATTTGIPRIIHQTHSSWHHLSADLQSNIQSTRELNPDFRYCFYDDEAVSQFIETAYGPAMLKQFLKINPKYGAARADLFRYLCLYFHGGVYLDIKAKVSRPLADGLLANDSYLLSHWNQELHPNYGKHPELSHLSAGEFQQWNIIASPRHPFLRAVISEVLDRLNHYDPRRTGWGKNAAIRLTGPIPYTLAIQPLLGVYPHRLIWIENDLGIDYSLYSDNKFHRQVLGSHYGKLTESPIRLGPLQSGWFWLIQRWQRCVSQAQAWQGKLLTRWRRSRGEKR